jgi:hypothetical protein
LEAENLLLARQCAAFEARLAHLHTPSHLELCAGPTMAPPRRDRLLRVSAAEMRNPLHRTALSTNFPRDGNSTH